MQKVAGGVTTQFVYDLAGHLIAQSNGSGTMQREYIWLDDLPVAMVDDTGSSPVIYFIQTDQLGTPQKITDSSANVIWDGVFDPFGNMVTVSGTNWGAANWGSYTWESGTPIPTLLRFPGQYSDAETALNQNWNRDYDPTIGRYVQSDPVGLGGGINTYAYVQSDPVANIDPLGLSSLVYNKAQGTLDIYNNQGQQVGSYPAGNNTTSSSNGPWPTGTFPYVGRTSHPESGPTGPYGSNGNFVFDVPGRVGMGVHSGRSGPQSPTLGCIRTTNDATAFLKNLNQTDRLQTLTVK